MLKVTQKFLDYFDLPDTKAIKETFKDFKDIESAVQKKVDEFEKEGIGIGDSGDSSGKPVSAKTGQKHSEQSELSEASKDVSVKSYAEALPKRPVKRHSGADIEIYSDVIPGQENHPHPRADHHIDIDLGDPAPQQAQKSAGVVKPVSSEDDAEETEEDKARRIARELLAEDMPKEEAVSVEERILDPKLEKMIEGMKQKESGAAKPASEIKPTKIAEKKGASEAEKQDDSQDEDDDTKPAEEFPGQFNKPKPKR
jgi:hypothetical protein